MVSHYVERERIYGKIGVTGCDQACDFITFFFLINSVPGYLLKDRAPALHPLSMATLGTGKPFETQQ